MNWFLIALISPALWAISNHLDKFLINRYFKSEAGGVGALIIFSSIIGFFMIPFVLFVQQNVWDISPFLIGVVIGGSFIYLVSQLLYFYALKKDEASIVVPLFQTIPIFGFILGYIFLGETLTVPQIIACLLIILGGVSLSLDLSEDKTRFKAKIFFQMLLSSFLLALGGLIFKIVVVQTDYWTTNFWGYVGEALVGVLILLFIKNYRVEFLKIMKESRVVVIGLNSFNEVVNVIANLALTFAFLLAPLALVQTVNGFQPFFVFMFGVILTLFFPYLGTEGLQKKQLIQKIIAIAVMFVGTYMLNT